MRRTRNQSKQQQPCEDNATNSASASESGDQMDSLNDSGTLKNISHEAVGKLLRRVNSRSSGKKNRKNTYNCQDVSIDMSESGPKGVEKQDSDMRSRKGSLEAENCNTYIQGATREDYGGTFHYIVDQRDESDDSDWEDGCIPNSNFKSNYTDDLIKGVTVEFDGSPDSGKRKPIRRFSAEDKEAAELVHKAHLLCLLARGRLIDGACDDPLIQAALLSLLPTNLLKISEASHVTANALAPIVHWFRNNFHIRSPGSEERPFRAAIDSALESHGGTPEEIAALSVALFRALNLTTRFVFILDVVSLKPFADKSQTPSQDASKAGSGIFNYPSLMVAGRSEILTSPTKSSFHSNKDHVGETSEKKTCKIEDSSLASGNSQIKETPVADQSSSKIFDPLLCRGQKDTSEGCCTEKYVGLKRKGDLEFEMQLEMALSATAVMACDSNTKNPSNTTPPMKKLKGIINEESPTCSQGISVAIGSRKSGPPLYWAEVYCTGENQTGRWVHVDAINSSIDGEQKVEAAAAACKTSLRYVVAFAGRGAKDVTRRYCTKWHKIASKRINTGWWDAVLAPLKHLESGATGDTVNLAKEHVDASNELMKVEHEQIAPEYSVQNSLIATRNSLEDMELETRALTEPLPTNQQAYRTHPLYAIERWLTKYQILHPKGPVLGFVSGHPVYPRACVQTLNTKHKWLREGLQLKPQELPLKFIQRSQKFHASEDDNRGDHDGNGNIELYGKWQMEPLCLPRAVNGIVPKNERGQVEVWSEKCLPPGTEHLRLPRVVPVVKRLEIDFAPAMVGFEFRNGRSFPVYDGIVVCSEFKDAIMEAYAEEEERREAEEKKRDEAEATSRWYQLLSSIITRQRLNNLYEDSPLSQTSSSIYKKNDNISARVGDSGDKKGQPLDTEPNSLQEFKLDIPSTTHSEAHEHIFLVENQDFDEEHLVRTKRCRCGFSVQVEEL